MARNEHLGQQSVDPKFQESPRRQQGRKPQQPSPPQKLKKKVGGRIGRTPGNRNR
jgi:hypothetical protein